MTWVRTRVDRVATVNARIGWKALTASEYQPDGYVFLATPNIKSEAIDFDNVNYISAYRYEESPELKLQPDDVLLAKDGNTLGITNIVRELPRPATVNGSIAVLRPFAVESRFLRYSLASSSTQGMIEAIKGGMGVPHLFQWDIKRLPLRLPPLDEQRRIADYLDHETVRIDALVEAKLRMVKLLQERLDEITEQMLSPRGEARRAKLGRFLSAKITDGPHETPEFLDEGVPFISIEAIANDRIRMDRCRFISGVAHREYSKKCSPRTGDVLLAKTGATIGKTAIVDVDQSFSIWSPLALLRPRKEVIRSEYLWFFLRSRSTQRLIRELATQSTQPNIAMGDIAALPICVPPLQRQDIIVNQLRGHSEAVHGGTIILHQQITLLQERRQALITAAVTGQLDTQGAA